MNAIQQKILIAIQKATPSDPMSFKDILNEVNFTSADLLSAELYELKDKRYVGHCYITRGGWSDNYYWPTGFKGIAKTLGPEPTGIKSSSLIKREPASWTAIKQIKQTPPTQPEDKDITMLKPNKSGAVRKLIDETPGITAKELLKAIAGESTKAAVINNANAVISYATKHPNYLCVMQRKPFQKQSERCFYNKKDYREDKKTDVIHQVPTAINNSPTSSPIEAEPTQAAPSSISVAVTTDHADTDYCIKRLSEQLSDEATISISKEKGGSILVTVTHNARIYQPKLDNISACLGAIQTLASLQVSQPN